MAIELYKEPEHRPGAWVFLKYDPETGEKIEGLIRETSPEVMRKLLRPWERPHRRKGKPTVWKLPKKLRDEYAMDVLHWAWLDIRGFEIRIPDDKDTVDFLSAELNDAVKPGDVVSLDGKLTRALKRFLCDADHEIQNRVSEATGTIMSDEDEEEERSNGEAEEMADERDEYLRENLASGSHSGSNTPASPSRSVEPASSTAERRSQPAASPRGS